MMWEMNFDIRMREKHWMKCRGENTQKPLDSCQIVFYIFKGSIGAG